MKDWKRALKKSLTDDEVRRYLRFLSLPLLAVVLIFAIVFSGGSGKRDRGEAGAVTGSEDEVRTGNRSDSLPAGGLQKNTAEEIDNLVNSFFQAKKDCDGEAMNRLFGGAYSPEEVTGMDKKLEDEAVLIEDYRNITCYKTAGLQPGSFVLYAEFDVKFRGVDTAAPSLAVHYVKRDENGEYYFDRETGAEETAYMADVNRSADVQILASQVNAKLRDALERDAALMAVYRSLLGEHGGEGT